MQAEELVDIFLSTERGPCAELALVLASQEIEAQVRLVGRNWVLSVPPGSVDAARRELTAYAAESSPRPVAPPVGRGPGSPWPGVIAYLAVIVGIEALAPDMRLGIDWLADGRMDGGRVLAGDWWRPVTALTLHADLGHLLGNAFFGAFFGYSVGRYLGAGFGWLAILLAGALGNAGNALLSGPDHRSIGASTAVFAALGILSAYCWRRGFPEGATRRERFAPVVAGLGLLAFTGTAGINTDLGAHLLGFIAGFGGGLLIVRFGFPRSKGLQLAAGAVALGLVCVSWLAAVA